MPRGTCMLSQECEPEYRIYLGDIFCGRTQFVCCALLRTNYDLQQGFDVSFGETAEMRVQTDDTMEKFLRSCKKKKWKGSKKRKKDRKKRKKLIQKAIKKEKKRVEKFLNQLVKNSTRERKRNKKKIKKFLKKLKKQHKKDKQSVQDIHTEQLMKIDYNTMLDLNKVKALNKEFKKNQTFRDIIINGTQLRSYGKYKPKKHDEYDIEYGILYY